VRTFPYPKEYNEGARRLPSPTPLELSWLTRQQTFDTDNFTICNYNSPIPISLLYSKAERAILGSPSSLYLAQKNFNHMAQIVDVAVEIYHATTGRFVRIYYYRSSEKAAFGSIRFLIALHFKNVSVNFLGCTRDQQPTPTWRPRACA